MKPPVAMLLYDPKELSRGLYLPFAGFSPEWQAIQYAFRQEIPIRPIDLPAGQQLALETAERGSLSFESSPESSEGRIERDPLAHIARLAGYSDSERWWELAFEQEEGHTDTFLAIQEMVVALRTGLDRLESRSTLLREAHMRIEIRKALSEGFVNIAVVCGAWHGPVLADYGRFTAAADKKLLRGLKKVTAKVAWIPWSYERLALQGGYGAGVIAPAWYELLFQDRPEVTVRWMGRVAKLLRQQGVDASTAHTLEGVRLAEALAALRRRSVPGMEELEEAAFTVFGDGDQQRLEIIREKLIIGDTIGKVPASVPKVPLQRDFEKCISSARLTRESKTTETIRKELDLRKPANLLASQLLHRLPVIGISWGTLREKSRRERLGSFSEEWKLKWRTDFVIRIIEAGMYGNTIEEASTNALLRQARDSSDLAVLSELVTSALKGDLKRAVDPLITRMQELAAQTRDLYRLMDALPAMVNIIRYGDSRQTDTEAVEILVDDLVPRICIGLSAAALQIDEELAADLFQRMLTTHHAIDLLDDEDHSLRWLKALRQTLSLPGTHELIRGACTRLLYDRGQLSSSETRNLMYFALSTAGEPMAFAAWLEGFLHGSALLLVHQPGLWTMIEEWVGQLDNEVFPQVLPLLRRIFSRFTAPERRKLMELVERGPQAEKAGSGYLELDNERVELMLPALRQLLGLAPVTKSPS